MMNRQDRAKQFAPFDALNGLREALAKKEYDFGKVERGEHSEELDSEISDKLSKVQRGDRIALTCYQDGYYVKVIGAVKEINTIFKYIVIGNGKVYFDDIYGIDRDLVYDDLSSTNPTYISDLENLFSRSPYKGCFKTLKEFLSSINEYFVKWRYAYASGALNFNLNTMSDVINLLDDYSMGKYRRIADVIANNVAPVADNQTMSISNFDDIKNR